MFIDIQSLLSWIEWVELNYYLFYQFCGIYAWCGSIVKNMEVIVLWPINVIWHMLIFIKLWCQHHTSASHIVPVDLLMSTISMCRLSNCIWQHLMPLTFSLFCMALQPCPEPMSLAGGLTLRASHRGVKPYQPCHVPDGRGESTVGYLPCHG